MPMKSMAFIRDYVQFSGGHLKVFDYFNHVASSGLYKPQIKFTERSRFDATNPWTRADIACAETWFSSEAFFVAGIDWRLLTDAGVDLTNRPVINLIQGIRHASPQDERFIYLNRRALRICVSEEVADAVRKSGRANGEVLTIPIGLHLDALVALQNVSKNCEVFIAGLKAPELAIRCADALRNKGVSVVVQTLPMQRSAFLDQMAAARVALLLPMHEEGFYLPALEAMASNVCVVVPDCIGNRTFCLDGTNCIISAFDLLSLTQAVLGLLARPEQQIHLKTAGRTTAATYNIDRERQQFIELLRNLERGL